MRAAAQPASRRAAQRPRRRRRSIRASATRRSSVSQVRTTCSGVLRGRRSRACACRRHWLVPSRRRAAGRGSAAHCSAPRYLEGCSRCWSADLTARPRPDACGHRALAPVSRFPCLRMPSEGPRLSTSDMWGLIGIVAAALFVILARRLPQLSSTCVESTARPRLMTQTADAARTEGVRGDNAARDAGPTLFRAEPVNGQGEARHGERGGSTDP